jgi:hypothetical protein
VARGTVKPLSTTTLSADVLRAVRGGQKSHVNACRRPSSARKGAPDSAIKLAFI